MNADVATSEKSNWNNLNELSRNDYKKCSIYHYLLTTVIWKAQMHKITPLMAIWNKYDMDKASSNWWVKLEEKCHYIDTIRSINFLSLLYANVEAFNALLQISSRINQLRWCSWVSNVLFWSQISQPLR